MDPPWAESTEVQNREYQSLHKMVIFKRKKYIKKLDYRFTTFSLISFQKCIDSDI